MTGGDDTRSQATADPVSPRGTDARGALVPCVQILFHSDLRRIGQYFPLERRAPAVEIGRDAPIFLGPGASARALLDPCVSRKQLEVRWHEQDGEFSVTTPAGARRAVSVLERGAAPRAIQQARLVPGALLGIGDRLVLGLVLRRLEPQPTSALLGDSLAMSELRTRVETLAATDETVLVTGDTGTGKELVARALHSRSARSARAFVPLNCAALPEQLLESELFGHEKGAFTGAVAPRSGLFRAAEGDTLFLDEVGELSLAAQAKLLRALQERAVRTVGRESERAVDVRIVAATNQSLSDAVREGRFRLDLLTRIEGLTIHLPPLVERRSDIPELFLAFMLRTLASRGLETPAWLIRDVSLYPPPIAFDFWCSLLTHDWPGNVRQLERVAMAAATLSVAEGSFVAPELSPALATAEYTPPSPKRRRPTREELSAALESNEFVQHRVAVSLGIPQATLARWLREAGIARPQELSAAEVEAALEHEAGDLAAAAGRLRVSARGLRLRVTQLGLEGRVRRRR